MMSTGYQWRGKQRAAQQAELPIRQAIRSLLRDLHPEGDRPPGANWVFWPTKAECPFCSTSLIRVVVPGYEATELSYCTSCNQAAESSGWLGEDLQ